MNENSKLYFYSNSSMIFLLKIKYYFQDKNFLIFKNKNGVIKRSCELIKKIKLYVFSINKDYFAFTLLDLSFEFNIYSIKDI